MARFSVGGEDDGERGGPSNRRPKRQRRTLVFEESIEEEEEEEDNENVEDGEGEDDEEGEEEEEEEEEEENVEEADYEEESHQNDCVSTAASNRDRSVSVTLTDLDVLDCAICYESLRIPIFQCDNGHIACSSCCAKVENKCPFCSWSIGYIRCRGMEKVLESVKVSCQNSQYGCREKLSYCKKDDHIEKCPYAPCSCPLPDCNFLGSVKQFSHHFLYKHSICHIGFQYSCLFPISLEKTDKFFLLREETEGALFILSNSIIERHGNTLSVNCIGPRSSKRGFSYDLIAKKGGSSLRLQCVTEGNSGQAKSPSTGFLLVPNDFFGISGMLKMDVCIRTNVSCPSCS